MRMFGWDASFLLTSNTTTVVSNKNKGHSYKYSTNREIFRSENSRHVFFQLYLRVEKENMLMRILFILSIIVSVVFCNDHVQIDFSNDADENKRDDSQSIFQGRIEVSKENRYI